jgi:predicted lipoprotein with Yx(FWY)xxD motif
MQEVTHVTDRRGNDGEVVRHEAITGTVAVLTVTAALAVIGFLAAGSIAATQTHTTVSLRKTKLGSILVNSSGHTIYLFGKDRKGKSACSGSCAKFWPPLLSHGKPTGGPSVKLSLLGTARRSNGSLQVTYNKHPLYTYTLDKRAGQTNGEGTLAFGAKWYAISAKGTAVVKATSTTNCPYPPC